MWQLIPTLPPETQRGIDYNKIMDIITWGMLLPHSVQLRPVTACCMHVQLQANLTSDHVA